MESMMTRKSQTIRRKRGARGKEKVRDVRQTLVVRNNTKRQTEVCRTYGVKDANTFS